MVQVIMFKLEVKVVFAQVPGYLVFGTGQPTSEGFKLVLDFILKETGAKSILWTNMRQVHSKPIS
jgi:hypothetical protein